MRFDARLLGVARSLSAHILLPVSTLKAQCPFMVFDWDAAKSEWNRQERGFGFDIAILISEGDTMEWPDDRRDYGERRVRAIGVVNGVVLHIVFTGRGGVRRIISARVANKRERNQWHASR